MGFYITQEPVPERKVKVEVDQDDVEMKPSAPVASAKTSRTRFIYLRFWEVSL